MDSYMKLTVFEKIRLLIGGASTVILGFLSLIFIVLLFGKSHDARLGAMLMLVCAAILESIILWISWGPYKKWKTRSVSAEMPGYRGLPYAGFGARFGG